MNGWILLVVAAAFEVSWAVALKFADGFTRWVPSAAALLAMTLSIVFLGLALSTIPLYTAYAVWTGLAVAGLTIFDILVLDTKAGVAQLAFVAAIVASVFGLFVLGTGR